LHRCCDIVFELLNAVHAKNLPIFNVNWNAQANALKSIGYTDTVLFLTIGNPDTYQHKSLVKSATVFIRVTKNDRNWLPTYLIFSAIDIRLTNIR
jgi:hypothetical protein